MTPLIPATYEHGIFKPLKPVRLPEHLRVILVVTPTNDEVPTLLLDRLAEESGSFTFLSDPREDLYTPADGEPC
jgi:predicted DNA-binding antitoxin AbrB/MazE fold protein